jgi:hypothetical protein
MATNVFYAGNLYKTSGEPVVSIFNNPYTTEDDSPLFERHRYIDRIYFDSRFDYLNINYQIDVTVPFPAVSSGGSGETITTIAYHNFGYPPVAILLDTDTREVVTNGNYIHIVNFSSYRTISFLMDSTRFYIKQQYSNKLDNLPAITRRYSIIAFSTTAQTPS